MVVRCVAETCAFLEWLATGQGRKFDDEELDIVKMPRRKIVDGVLYEAGMYLSLIHIGRRRRRLRVRARSSQLLLKNTY